MGGWMNNDLIIRWTERYSMEADESKDALQTRHTIMRHGSCFREYIVRNCLKVVRMNNMPDNLWHLCFLIHPRNDSRHMTNSAVTSPGLKDGKVDERHPPPSFLLMMIERRYCSGATRPSNPRWSALKS